MISQEAIQSLGLDANYTQGPASMRGILAARMEGSRATFDLQSVSDRLFAIELASTWRAVTDAAAEKLRRWPCFFHMFAKPCNSA